MNFARIAALFFNPVTKRFTILTHVFVSDRSHRPPSAQTNRAPEEHVPYGASAAVLEKAFPSMILLQVHRQFLGWSPASHWVGRPASPWVGRPASPWVGPPAGPWVGRPASPWVGRPASPWVGRPASPWVGRPPVLGLVAFSQYRDEPPPEFPQHFNLVRNR